MENEYLGLSQDQLLEQHAATQERINAIHTQRAELNREERDAIEHRYLIERALGVFILDDARERLF